MADMSARMEKYLSSNSVSGGKSLRLTIKDILFDVPIRNRNSGCDEPEDILTFQEDHRGLILKPCHTLSMKEITGSTDSDDWVGVEVEAFETETTYGGRPTKALRLRRPAA
jgi:hypothetical protein